MHCICVSEILNRHAVASVGAVSDKPSCLPQRRVSLTSSISCNISIARNASLSRALATFAYHQTARDLVMFYEFTDRQQMALNAEVLLTC